MIKLKLSHLSFVFCAYFVICALVFGFLTEAHALNLEKAREYFLKGDYQACINECEGILARSQYSKDLDELYYLLGLSYLKKKALLRSYDVFEILVKEFKDSYYKQDALLAQADIYFLKENYNKALFEYKQLLNVYPHSRLKVFIYFRLIKAHLKIGSWQEARNFKDKLEREFPLSFENQLAKIIYPKESYFTIQVGAFSKQSNAKNLSEELIQAGYSAFIQEKINQLGKKIYRVRVGRLSSRQEAKQLEFRLKNEGYPTKIYP